MRAVVLFVTLFAFYLSLSGQIHNNFLLIIGGVACLVTTLVSVRMGNVDDEGVPVDRWPRTFLYIPWLMWEIFKANIDVAKQVWFPKRYPIDPRMIEVRHGLKTGYGVATFANSITLTPGTVTVETDREGEPIFLVHALSAGPAQDLLEGGMHEMVAWVEGTELPKDFNPNPNPNPGPDPGPDAEPPAKRDDDPEVEDDA